MKQEIFIIFSKNKKTDDFWTLLFNIYFFGGSLIRVFSDEEIKDIVKMYSTFPEDEHETISLLNDIFLASIIYLKEELLFQDKEFGNVLKTKFNSLNSFYDFLRSTKNKKGKIKCTILKHMLTIYDSAGKYNPRVNEITEKTSRVIDNKLKKGAIQVIFESEDGNFLRGVVYLHGKAVFFNMKRRLKSEKSRIMKSMNDPKYSSIERLCDNYGVTFEMDDVEDIPMFANYIADKTFKRGIFDIKLRSSIPSDEIETNPYLSEDFRTKWLGANNMRKPETPDGLDDVRIVTPMYKGDKINNMSLEYRFVSGENLNETGIIMHDVMGHFKKIKSRIRSESYINPEYIERIAIDFFIQLEDLLLKNNLRENKDIDSYKKELFKDLKKHGFINPHHKLSLNETKNNLDSLLLDGLIGYYKALLTPIKINSVGKMKYTLKRNVKISEELGLYFDLFKEETV